MLWHESSAEEGRVPSPGKDFGNLEVCKLPQRLHSTGDLDQSLAPLVRQECLDRALKTKGDWLTSPVDTPVSPHDLLKMADAQPTQVGG